MTARSRRAATSSRSRSKRPHPIDSPLAPFSLARLDVGSRLVALAALVGLGIWSRSRYWNYCIHDDAFISFRYARNLVRGEGLVMNPGERVEGYTNFLWTVLTAPVLQLGLDPIWFTQMLGSLLALGLVVGVYVFSTRHLGSGWFALVAPAFLIGNLAFILESLSGLETMAFAVLAFATTVLFLEERRRGTGYRGAWAALAAAATLVRPEGALLFGVLATYGLLGALRGEPWRPWLRCVGIFALLLLPFLVFRLAYYGPPFPNTFYVKVGYTTAQLARGWRYTDAVLLYALTPILLLVAAFGTTLTLAWRRLGTHPRREALAVVSLVCLAHLAYVVAVGGDYEPTARFYMPVLVWLYVLIQEAGHTLFLLARQRGRRIGLTTGIVAFVLLGMSLFESERRFIQLISSRGWPLTRWEHHQELAAVGTWLRLNTPPGITIAVSSIGALPWYADRPILDMMGLTDAHIGRLRMQRMGQGPAGHEKGDGAYVLQRRPDIILLDRGHLFDHEASWSEIRQGARGISELELVQTPAFAEQYELRRAPMSAGVLHWFQKKQ